MLTLVSVINEYLMNWLNPAKWPCHQFIFCHFCSAFWSTIYFHVLDLKERTIPKTTFSIFFLLKKALNTTFKLK